MKYRFVSVLLLLVSSGAMAEDAIETNLFPRRRMTRDERHFTTPAYQQEALRLVLEEANQIAVDFHLPEHVPITRSNLVEVMIFPPRFGQVIGLGNISTSNYTYFVRLEQKLTDVALRNILSSYTRLPKDQLVPLSRIDTNAAFQAAKEMLAGASVDVAALNRDCTVEIIPYIPEDNPRRFSQIYMIYWFTRGKEEEGSIAAFEFFLPTRTVRRLSIGRRGYSLRRSLTITNLTELLSQTNAAPVERVPSDAPE
jgi:hypothetical protein